jgi:hypothetical protein
MIEKEIDQNAFDVVLRDIRLKVCDCVALVREDSAVLRIAFPCLNLSWSALPVEVVGPSGDQFLVTDGGQVLRQLQRSASNEETRRRMDLQLRTAAEQFGMEQTATDYRSVCPLTEAGDALSRMLQFLSRCETALDLRLDHAARTREQFVALLTQCSGLPAHQWLEPLSGLGEFQPLRLRSQPPWQVLLIESDHDAQLALTLCQARELRENTDQVLAVYRNQMRINRRLVAQLTNLVDKQFASIADSQRIERFLRSLVPAGGV